MADLANHKRRIEEKAAEHKRACDEAQEYREAFTVPWDAAWRLLEGILEQRRSSRGESVQGRIAEVIRQIVRLAKQEGIEEDIRIAAERCEHLAATDPSGRKIQNYKIADIDAVLTVFLVALENDSQLESSIAMLELEHHFVGEDVRYEVEYARQRQEVFPSGDSLSLPNSESKGEIHKPLPIAPATLAIPLEFRTRIMSKKEAAKYHNKGGVANPTDYFNGLIRKGMLIPPTGSGRRWQFDKRNFPQDDETQKAIS